MDNEYVLIYTPYITRKGVRIWASQYGLKAARRAPQFSKR